MNGLLLMTKLSLLTVTWSQDMYSQEGSCDDAEALASEPECVEFKGLGVCILGRTDSL